MRKLVQLDEDTWGWSEIDPIKLRRTALELKAWLSAVDPTQDPFGFLQYDLPLVEAALNGTMALPFKGSEPHTRELGEGWLPRNYTRISAPFYNTIRGAHLEPPAIVEVDGKRFAWADFEEPDGT